MTLWKGHMIRRPKICEIKQTDIKFEEDLVTNVAMQFNVSRGLIGL